MNTNSETPKEELIGTIDDLEITDDVLYANNTFSLRALNETLERLSLINFWSLYQTQRARLHMERFDIPFSEFKAVYRLAGEKSRDYYPRRYIAYMDYTFIRPELRKKYKRSELYGLALNQEQIASNSDIFRYNHLVFIDGDYIFTTEVYPQESKTGIIIDVESNHNEHGITYSDYVRYSETNPTVTIIMVPNYKFSSLTANQYVIDKYNGVVPFDKINRSSLFTKDTICFLNNEEGLARRFISSKIAIDMDNKNVVFGNDLGAGGKKYLLAFMTFDSLYDRLEVTTDNPYIQLHTKMPCPKEQLLVMIKGTDGKIRFDSGITIDMFYPNIYRINNIPEGETAVVFVMQDEETVTDSEEYVNELAKYEEYVSMLPKYTDMTIPEILKTYRPASFIYSIEDYEGSIYMPNTLNYKVAKLHKTIYENPWALVVYLDILNLPSDKFYLDMEKIDLDNRIRRDSSREDVDSGTPIAEFDEDMYVFAMNRHYVDTRSYGFRIFIDGLFQLDNTYTILPGPNFYFIYIPASKITPTSMIEIERYKLFTVEKRSSTDSFDTPLLELDFSDNRGMIGYSREIYVVDTTDMMYIGRTDFRIDVLYKFAEKADKWTTIPDHRNIALENKVRVYITNEKYLGRTLRVGIQRRCAMSTGDVYHEPSEEDKQTFWYTKGRINNFGGYDRGSYRIFNNGRLLLPVQYYINQTMKYGGEDFFRTSCELHEGDRFTIDHVPAQFRVIYYQHEVDMDNKKGYVDLDGKVPLPISLKWYDIYLDGRKLNKKNLEIISPTKFYVQNVDSRYHLVIVAKNRDPEFFHLPSYTNSMETPDAVDWNNTVIDDLMETANELKEIIDASKEEIDPNGETYNIATNVCMNINAMIFFFEHFMYTFINANWSQITQNIKEAFPMLLNDWGVMPIDSNDGCVRDESIGGYLIKPIDCNIKVGEEDMFTDPNVDYKGIGALQDRFAIRPLNTDNYEFGLKDEFMTDPNTAEPAIVNEDGTVTALNTMVRIKHHIETFSSNITLYGMGYADIYQLTFDDEYKTKLFVNDENLLTEEIETDKPIEKLCISLDTTFLTQVGDCKMLKVADIDPTVSVGYYVDGAAKGFSCTLTRLKDNLIEEDGKVVKLSSIVIKDIPDTVTKAFIHSILLAY
jgi:hypothetical protein